MIKFSVITITYNAASVLERTLESVASQTYPVIEHIIVDGASEDTTVAIAEEYRRQTEKACNGHQVYVTSEPDRGLYDAMNKGLERAAGTYVVFMNAGDTFASPATLEEIAEKAGLNVMENEGLPLPAVLYGDTDIYDAHGNYLRHRHLSAPEQLSWRSFRNGMLVCHQSFYARTDIAKRFRYDLKYRYSADVDWCICVMKEAERRALSLENVHQVVTHYLQEGQTTLHHRESLKERFSVMCRHYGTLVTLFMHLLFAFRTLKRNRSSIR
ncbi:MAG: glycosyltransferase family 2 protein [Prevotella sp.]|uniref:glycosyltransferase family 2 protein n=1 Tax=Prevotella sp. TaxID=59823 RepID=UPI002A25E145|nr:glycosyltransferase family 2 protein [Prevotella sp.]MDD7317747.1 glycosyltransferase family 2 protein [Prevotellaceae bacterium]MDY4020662.1 glycosyltransferase family 2 protein [Prevotella sp.]